MSDTETYFQDFKNKQIEEFNMKKQFINYDKLIDNLINEKQSNILKKQIEIKQLEMNILILNNDIKRIKEEQLKSSYNSIHIFINPCLEYDKIIKSNN